MKKSDVMRKAWEIKRHFNLSMSASLKAAWCIYRKYSAPRNSIERMEERINPFKGVKILKTIVTGDQNYVIVSDEKTGAEIVREYDGTVWGDFNGVLKKYAV